MTVFALLVLPGAQAGAAGRMQQNSGWCRRVQSIASNFREEVRRGERGRHEREDGYNGSAIEDLQAAVSKGKKALHDYKALFHSSAPQELRGSLRTMASTREDTVSVSRHRALVRARETINRYLRSECDLNWKAPYLR